ncbi:MAG: phage portal protein [Mogibacterium sp.]|nr:phage portal protein [Mogibacterium sp.]
MELTRIPAIIHGLSPAEREMFSELVNIYTYHRGKNAKKAKYYDGNIPLNKVNLGIALPDGLSGLEIGCAWGAKTVDVLARRSMFDGFVGTGGGDIEELNQIVIDNQLVAGYQKATKDELKFGCTFYTFSADSSFQSKVRVRTHSPQTAAARWNGEKGRIDCGMAIIDTAKDESERGTWKPTKINLYTDDAIIVLSERGYSWHAEKYTHRLGRPLMEPLIWNPTSDKPLGQSRIKEPVRRLIEGYVRTVANATIGLEFATSPQKYLLGISDEQYDQVVSNKFRQYVGSVLASTTNPENGEKPQFGQLPQGSIAPHVDMLRILSTQFSAATGLTVTDTGVVNDANPTSSDAILAQSQTLIATAEELNKGNGEALKTIALIALAISNNTTIEGLSDEQRDIVAHFKNPSMPSVAATSDAAIKIASAREGFAETDVFLEMIGFDQADIRRIKAQEQRTRGMQLLEYLENEPDMNGDEEGADPADEA